MTHARPAAGEEDLGGGFRYVPHLGAAGAIIAGSLEPFGIDGLMSTAAVNARDRDAFRAWADALRPGLSPRLRGVDQVHGATIVAAENVRGDQRLEADGVSAGSADDAPVIMAADCAPVWLADPQRKAVALVHAGWRGIAAGVLEAGVRACEERGAQPGSLIAAIGPHLGPCCFEIGPEVAAQFSGHTQPATSLVVERQRTDSVALNAASAISARLRAAGVRSVHVSHACTRSRGDILHSFRRNGKGGPLMGAIGVITAGSVS
jgi:YfiH family protein